MNFLARRRWEAHMGLGITEIPLILLIAMLFIGWRDLPDLPHAVVKSMKGIKRRRSGATGCN